MTKLECICEPDLRAFVLGELPSRVEKLVAAHLANCGACEAAVQQLDKATDPVIRGLRRVLGGDSQTIRPDSQPTGTSAPSTTDTPTAPPGYEVLRELGRGGMGVVYLARQRHPHRLVALKVMLAGSHAGAAGKARFLAEANVLAQLRHPNIVQIFEVSETAGLPYLALEYVEGGTLAQQLRGEPKTARDSAQLISVLAGAVHVAHESGVIHRDLKPANVLMGTGQWGADLKISDFGLAKHSGPELTATGELLGTPAYMAPEQARGKHDAVDVRSDVYALGAILYEMLTGCRPFCGESHVDTLKLVCEMDPISPRQLRPKLPRDLETVCLKCLEKDPTRRYPSAAELKQDLQRFLDGGSVQARPIGRMARSWRWCRRHPAVSSLSTLLVLAIAMGTAGIVRAYGLAKNERDAAIGERDRTGRLFDNARGSIQELIEQGHELVHAPATVRQGLDMLEVGRRYYTKLLNEDPTDRKLRQQAVLICKRLGMIYNERQEIAPADSAWSEAIEHAEKLMNGLDGETYRKDYYDLIVHRAEELMVARRYDDVFLVTDSAVNLARANSAARPNDAEIAWQLHAPLLFRGISARQAERWEQADAELSEGLAIVRKFGEQFGVEKHFNIEANYLNQLSATAIGRHRIPAAIDFSQEAVNVGRRAVEAFPTNPDICACLAGTLSFLGRARYNNRDWSGTVDADREAHEIFIRQWKHSKNQAGAYERIALGTKLIADSLDQMSRDLEAIPDLQKLIELEPPTRLVRNNPNPPDLFECYGRLAHLLVKSGKVDDARRVHAEAMTRFAAVPDKSHGFTTAEKWLTAVAEEMAK
ncbi:MAG: protein kinase domain-containing protein [Gemmataceae bacterium]